MRATPDAMPGLCPPWAVCELPSRLKVAIVNWVPAPDDCVVAGVVDVVVAAVGTELSAGTVVDENEVPAPGWAGSWRRTGAGVTVGFGLSLIGAGEGDGIGVALP